MDQAAAGLIGAAIGASGAVTAQVLASVFSQRTDTKRFDWERQQAERREASEYGQRFLDHKRELFAAFLSAHASFRASRLARLPDSPSEDQIKNLLDTFVTQHDHASLLAEEITLIAPSLAGPCRDLMLASTKALVHVTTTEGREPRKDHLAAYLVAIDGCRSAMTEHLGA